MMRTKNIVFLALIAFFMMADVLLLVRYASWGSTWEELLPFLVFTLLAEAAIAYSVYVYNRVINPFCIYALFIYAAGFSFIRISAKQQLYDLHFILALGLTIVCFLAGGLLAMKTSGFSFKNVWRPLTPGMSFALLLVLLVTGMGVFVLEIRQLGYIPILNLGNTGIYDDLNENEVTPLHNFIVLNSVLPAMFYINYKKGFIPFILFLLLSAISGFIVLNFFSRQIIILFFLSLLIAVNYYKNIPVLKLSVIGAVCLIFFILLGQIRNTSESNDMTASINDFLKEYNQVYKPTNILETYLSLYGGVNFSTANRIIEQAANDGYHSYGVYTARPLITVLPVNKDLVYPPLYSAYVQLGTYMVDPYLDFRWAGVVVLNFLYGFLSMNSFKNYVKRKGAYYIVEWSLFIFCLFMCSFTNFFNMFFVMFFFMINRIATK